MTRQVLVGIDGSPQSQTAADWAAAEAQRSGAPLRLLHAWPWLTGANSPDTATSYPGDLRTAALHALTDTADRIRRAHPGLAVETEVIGDEPVDALMHACAGQSLLVLGSRGLGGFAALLVGSVGLAVAARAPVPVVLVRPDSCPNAAAPGAQGPTVREVVVGLDAHHPVDAVLDFAFTEAGRRGARLHAVHGWNPLPAWSLANWVPPRSEVAAQQACEEAELTQMLASWRERYPEVEVAELVRLGGAAGVLMDACTGADLVVVGRRDRRHDLGPRLGPRLGPVAHAVLHHAATPVAVVPHP
ncbi:universal stress protein [Kitasatospora sp. NPDC050463]|uniref:universal stress protein n=1 Tax=Kitasatospora sp. NPDC050463 TaxID=3155786 RepID=UPI0033DC65CE